MTLPSWFWRARLWLVAAFTYAFFVSGGDPNQSTRFALTESIVERHAPDITPIHWRTIDKGYKDGRFYSDKAPGVALLSVPAYALMRGADAAFGIAPTSREAQLAKLYFLTLLFGVAAGVVCVVLVRRLALGLGCSPAASELAAFAYAFGTIAFPFSTVLFGHQFVAAILLGSFVLLVEGHARGALGSPRRLASLGALWALSLVTEYPTGLIVATFGIATLVWTFDRARPAASLARTLLLTGAGGIGPVVVHALFLKWAYGSFVTLPYAFVSEPFFRAHMSGGILGIGVPNVIATVGTLFSPYRGLLFLCPVLALSVAGFGAWVASDRDRRPLWLILPALALYLLFAFSYYAWDGGGSTGPRHLLPMLPYLALALAFFADHSRVTFGVAAALTAVSCFVMLACTSVIVQMPTGDPFVSNPLYDLVLPALLRGRAALNAQDAFIPYPRADASFDLGTLLGLGRASLLVVPAVWAAAYLPSLARLRRRAHA